jgi:hypothetical protein
VLRKTDKPITEIRATMAKLAILATIREHLRRRKYYRCTCGWEILKTDAKLSGYPDDIMYGLHVHCGRCGLIIQTHIHGED